MADFRDLRNVKMGIGEFGRFEDISVDRSGVLNRSLIRPTPVDRYEASSVPEFFGYHPR